MYHWGIFHATHWLLDISGQQSQGHASAHPSLYPIRVDWQHRKERCVTRQIDTANPEREEGTLLNYPIHLGIFENGRVSLLELL